MKTSCLLTLAILGLASCKPPAAPPAPLPPAPTASPKPAAETSDFTGEKAANVSQITQGPSLPEANAEVPPALPVPIVTRAIYVSPDAAPKNKGLSPESPVTPQKAAYMTQPGDVVIFAAGEYVAAEGKTLFTIERSGAPGQPVIYTPAPGAKVVLRGNFSWECIKIVGASYIEIRNFRVIGSAGQITLPEAIKEMSNLKNPRTCGNGIGIDWKQPEKIPPQHVTISDCVISDCSGGGLFANHADYLTFEHNVVFRCAFWSPYGNSGISLYQPVDTDSNSTNYKLIIRNNVSFGNYENIPFYHSNKADPAKRKITDGNGIILDDFLSSQAFGGGAGKPYNGRTLVANNVVFANGGSGIHAFKSNHVDVLYNYAFGNNKHPNLKDGQIFGNKSVNMRIANNILVAPAGKPVNTDNQNKGLVQDHNVYASLDGSVPKFAGEPAGNILASPGLDLTGWDQGQREFKAAADSPLRGAGIPFPGVNADFFNRSRDSEQPDIGPFVLSASAGK